MFKYEFGVEKLLDTPSEKPVNAFSFDALTRPRVWTWTLRKKTQVE